MRLRRSDGSSDDIEADFEIGVGDPPHVFTVTIESSGGATGSGNVRNPEYPLLIEEVLRRLSSLDVYLMDAFVDSRRVAHLPEAERRINVDGRPFPIRLAPDEDFTALRRGLTRPQGDIGSSRSIGGGRMGREDFLAKYQAPAARRYMVVDGDDEMDAMALILGARAIAGLPIEGTWRGDRENIATPLRRLGFAVEDLERPSEGPLGPDPQTYVGLAERLGGTDVAVKRMGRREQRYLRGALGIATGDPNAVAACGMCGRTFPHAFLIAAHIKPRHMCSDAERLDLPHVGWALCVAGCDAMFEQGYVGVDDVGRIVALHPAAAIPPAVADLMEPLLGTEAPGWSADRAVYFKAHRTRHGA